MAAELTDVAPHPRADAEARLVGGARRDYVDGLERARSYLLSTRYYRLLDALDSFTDWPPLTDRAAQPARGEIRRNLAKAAAAVAKKTTAVPNADNPEEALHEVRKAARRLRYAADAIARAEPVAPVDPAAGTGASLTKPAGKKTGKKARKQARRQAKSAAKRTAAVQKRAGRIADAAKPLVKRLGDRHDGLLYIEELEQTARSAHQDGENTLLYGLLVARAEHRDDTVAVALADAKKTVRELERLIGKL
jgi:CHAD domain-containing protein